VCRRYGSETQREGGNTDGLIAKRDRRRLEDFDSAASRHMANYRGESRTIFKQVSLFKTVLIVH